MGTELEQIGDEEETAGTRGREASFEKISHVLLDAVPGHDMGARLACPIEDFSLLGGEKARRERHTGHPFFWPSRSRQAPGRLGGH